MTAALLVLLACSGSTVEDARVREAPAPPPAEDPHWVALPGGTFMMGSVDGGVFGREGPRHEVAVKPFRIARHEALSTDYARCVEDGACKPVPADCAQGTDPAVPQNCLTWEQSSAFCTWQGGRLLSEAEWEYAATSLGKDHEHPWGNEPHDCTRANKGIGDAPWCPGGPMVWPVCQHPAGNTEQGVCEMGGNLFEWVEDWFDWNYDSHPTDGSAQKVPLTEHRVMRGGAVGTGEPVETRHRTYHPPDFQYAGMGTRCAMDLPAR